MSLFVSCLDREASSNFDWTMHMLRFNLFFNFSILVCILFSFVLGVVMYGKEFETKDEIEPQHIYSYFCTAGWCPQSGEDKGYQRVC